MLLLLDKEEKKKKKRTSTDSHPPNNRSARDSKPIEVIGTYNPIPQKPTGLTDLEAESAKPYKEIALDRSRAKYWLGVGAQPSDTVWRLFAMVRLGV